MIISKFTNSYLCNNYCHTSAFPRYEGQLMSDGAEPIPPSAQSSSYSLTTLSSHVSTDRREVTDMNGWYRRGR